MLTDTEGIVLRQVKTSYGRRMILLFTKKYGKISAGTSIGEKGRSRSSLALRPFTFGHYELFRNRDSYNINGADVVKAYYRIGEDVDKYMNGAYVLEFTEKVLGENVPAPGVFTLLVDFLNLLEDRDRGIGTLVLAYQTKLMKSLGVMPVLERCTVCGRAMDDEDAAEGCGRSFFSIENGGIVCDRCAVKILQSDEEKTTGNSLIYQSEFGIIGVLKYFSANPLKKLKNVALSESTGKLLQQILREYAAYYLDVSDIKSEKMI
ncbi:MAG: DNA repair protein RecO [Lentihominibacter sp.]|jgi:DNA repair protein RecO (recombination protein O)